MPTTSDVAPASDVPRLRTVLLDILSGTPEVYLREPDADRIGVRPLDRVRVAAAGRVAEFSAVVNVTGLVEDGCIGLARDLAARLAIAPDTLLSARPAPRPPSVDCIRRKLDGHELTPAEVASVIHDVSGGHLTSVELACWASAIHVHGMTTGETVACVQAMVESGQRITWNGQAIYDVHSIGGVPGNKYAPIVVAIAAAAGLRIPKTSSRAISSACGTADFMEVLAPVALDAPTLKRITQQTGGVLAWGGGVAMAPADDEIIRVEYPLGLDPPAQIVASVLAKKLAMGVTRVIIDIPAGPGAKVRDAQAAASMTARFTEVGQRLGLDVRCLVTVGGRPLGRAVGPVLEAREMLQFLEAGGVDGELQRKSLQLAGALLELAGKAQAGRGPELAASLLRSGAAHRKLLEILRAQGGDDQVRSEALRPGAFVFDAIATHAGPFELSTQALVAIARAAGAPQSKPAGVLLLQELGANVQAGTPLLRVHAEASARLDNAWETVQRLTGFQCRRQAAG